MTLYKLLDYLTSETIIIDIITTIGSRIVISGDTVDPFVNTPKINLSVAKVCEKLSNDNYLKSAEVISFSPELVVTSNSIISGITVHVKLPEVIE